MNRGEVCSHLGKPTQAPCPYCEITRLRILIRRAVEWEPTFPLEASLADEMAEALGGAHA